MSITIDPVLKNVLHLDSDDPSAFVVAVFKGSRGLLGQLQNRAVHRAGLSVVTIADADPTKPGQQHAKIDLRVSSGDTWEHVAAKMATFIMRGSKAQQLLIDEARLMLMGQHEGPASKALDADEHGNPDFHVESTDLVPDTAFHLLAHGGSRGLLGFDEATAAAVLAIAIPLLCAVIPVVLPMIIQLGMSAFQVISQAVTGQGANKPPPGPPPPANILDAAADKIGIGTPGVDDTFKVVIILGALVAGAIYLRRHGKLGG